MSENRAGFGIGDVVERTGVPEATLRMWERRHGFPAPARLASGHRRYSDLDIELIGRVASQRAAGLSLAPAIAAVRAQAHTPVASVYATLRQRWADLEPRALTKPVMLALTHAIEDETLARAQRGLLFGSFQRERFYRQAEPRWRELARGAEHAIAFADFPRLRTPARGAAEVPVPRTDPLGREWALVCEADGYAVCLAGWEPPSSSGAPDPQRTFEAFWSVEPTVVREAARICVTIAAAQLPGLPERTRRLDSPPAQTTSAQLMLASAITSRTLEYVSQPLIRHRR
jgi:DICT domain-containing protein